MGRALTTTLQKQERALQVLRRRLEARDVARRFAVIRGRLQAADAKLSVTVQRRTDRAAGALRALTGRLDSLSPLAVLARGYAVCWNEERTAILEGRAGEPLIRLVALRLPVLCRLREIP